MNHLTYAVRALRKNLSFSVMVVLVLALGIGGNVAIFSIVNGVLLQPLPYDEPSRLVVLWGNVQRAAVERRGGSMPDYRDWVGQNRSFDGLAVFFNQLFTLRDVEERVPIEAQVVGARYLDLLGKPPVLGRDFRPEEETDSTLPPVAIISHDLWTQRFGSDPAVVGNQLAFDNSSYTVIGVAPAGFRGLGDRAKMWIPLAALPAAQQNFRDRGTRGFAVLGRLGDGITRVQAQTDMDRVSRELERQYPETNEKRGVEVASLAEETFGNIRPALFALLAAVGVVLLIGCANVANLVLLRTENRQSELAIRRALGAARLDLLKLVFSETALLSFGGAAAGVLISTWLVDLILFISPIQLPGFVNIALDRTVLLFAAGLAGVTAVLMAIAPALQFTRRELNTMLASNPPKSSASQSAKRFRQALVVAEVALSFVLLMSAGLLIQSFRNLLSVDTGFETSNLLGVRLGFENRSAAKAIQVQQALQNLPGVQSAVLSSVIPFAGSGAVFYSAEGADPLRDASTAPRAYLQFVAPGFFSTMNIPLRAGREFTTSDGESSVIVSEKVVQRFWPGQDPVGKRIRIGRDNSSNPWLNIVGVVGDTRTRGIPENPTGDPDLYFTFGMFGGSPSVLLRTRTDAAAMIPLVVDTVRRLDKMVIVSNISTVEDLMKPLTARARFLSSMSAVFSGLALALALIGIYGSISYTVRQRTREIGVRVALGARRGHLLRLVLSQSFVLIGAGLAAGFVCSLIAGRGISNLLFGVTATAPSMFAVASLLLMLTGLGAAYVPARRASRVDPVIALRQD